MTNGNILIVNNVRDSRIHTRSDGYPLGVALKIYNALTYIGTFERNVPIENALVATNICSMGIGFDDVEVTYEYELNMKNTTVLVKNKGAVLSEEPLVEFLSLEITREIKRLGKKEILSQLDIKEKSYLEGLSLFINNGADEVYTGEQRALMIERYEEKAKTFKKDNPNHEGYLSKAKKMKSLERAL